MVDARSPAGASGRAPEDRSAARQITSESKTTSSTPQDQDSGINGSFGLAGPTDVVARGRDAWKRLADDQTWEDWKLVGAALQIGRTEVMRVAHVNQPHGRGYNDAFGRWLEREKFESLDKGDRSRLFDCMAHLANIEAWRQTLPLNIRQRLNHPNSVLRRWRASTTISNASHKKPSAFQQLKDQNIRLQEQLHRAQRNDGGNLWLPGDTVSDIANVLVPHLLRLSENKSLTLIKELQRRLKSHYAKEGGAP